MFDRKLLYTLISIGAVVVVTLALEYLPGRQQAAPEELLAPAGETAGASFPEMLIPRERVTRTPEPDLEPVYILREWKGYIAVFVEGESEPQLVLEQQVRFLPDIDRLHLQEGITVKGRAELAALIEDYIS